MKEPLKTMLIVIGIVNILLGVVMLILVHKPATKISAMSCITVGASCIAIYAAKNKKGENK